MIHRELLLICSLTEAHSNPYAANVLGMRSNMQVATKLFVAFWVSFFTLAKSQDCLKDNIDYNYVQKSDLLDSYPTGHILKLKCVFGYVGLPKLECKNGVWKESGRECKKKACGHPGDTPNGHFSLLKESEFVYGATVEYTCNAGYLMASRVNYRNCRSQGWDNAVPVCEVVQCRPISNMGDMTATGNTEEASFGDVIHFECPLNKMINGSSDLHCKADGQWSSVLPECIEIKCRPPKIPHGFTSLEKVYYNNNILQYDCDEGYKTRIGNSKCTRDGWTIQPACEEITCDYPYGAHLINPQPHNVVTYKLTQKIQYHCERGYRSHRTDNITCTVEGWAPKPQCVAITCKRPEVAHGTVFRSSSYYYYPGQQLDIRCNPDYEPRRFTVKCEQNGEWDKLPQCNLNKETCAESSVQNGFTHQSSKKFSYSCDSKFKAFDEKWWGVVNCDKGEWSDTPLCIPNNQCGQIPNDITQKQSQKGNKNGETVEFECESKPCCFKCTRGKWEEQQCKEICGPPPPAENAVVVSRSQREAEYACRENYDMKGNSLIRCDKSQWDKPPTCKHTCAETSVQNGFTHQSSKKFSYSCDSKFKAFDGKWWGVVSCDNGEWSDTPLCIPNDQCGQISNVNGHNQMKKGIPNGETVAFQCESAPCCFKCSSGTWDTQACKEMCGPPPPAENAVVVSRGQQEAEYACRENYDMKGNSLIRCDKSQWDKPPTCEKTKTIQ